jgi:hypothetical protein
MTSPAITPTQSYVEPKWQQRASFNTTTYYHYDKDGHLQSASTDRPVAHGLPGQLDFKYYEERGDIVGSYLARRGPTYPASTLSDDPSKASFEDEEYGEPSLDAHSDTTQDIRHQSTELYESYHGSSPNWRYPDYASTIGYAGFAARSGCYLPYPNVEDIRHLHTLQSLLPFIQPERKLNALEDRTMIMDIVEDKTGEVFAYEVPKKLLVLFLGRKVVNKFIRTIEREDNEKWRGKPVVQELRIPKGEGTTQAFHVLVSWMRRACEYRTMGRMRQFRVPNTTLTACALAQILTLFGLHKDAERVNWTITKENFTRPIFPVELEALWNRLGEHNRYVYAAIKVISQRLRVYEIGSTRQHPIWEELVALLEEYPPLKARVRDLELNEKYSPTYDTEWCKKLDGAAQTAKMAMGF